MYRFNGCTENASKALNRAMEIAGELGHDYVGSEHMLLGILDLGDSAASQVLERLGVTKQAFEQLVKERIGVNSPCEVTPSDFTPRSKRILQIAAAQAARLGHRYVEQSISCWQFWKRERATASAF